MSVDLAYLSADVFPLSPIARAALSDRPRPRALPGMVVPARVGDVAEPEDRFDQEERRELATILERELGRHEPHVAVLESARALATPGATCVVTGQQPGFLGGPLYNVYKALTAIRLARDLSNAWERPVVPLFWNHGDDHDIAEVHSLHVVNPNLDLRKVSLAGMSSGKRPFSSIVLDEDEHRLTAIAELLRQTVPETTDSTRREDAIELFLPRAGESLASAFTRTMLGLLGEQGLIVLEPDWIRPSLSRALARIVSLDPLPALEEGAAALRAAGHDVAIDPATAALVFHHQDGKRVALRAGGDGFRYDDEPGSRTPAELAAEIVQAPQDWSAGALLRPLVQDEALPVAAYVGGWGELAYHAELPPLRARAELPATPFVPRLSATLVDAETRRSLTKLELDVKDAVVGRPVDDDEEDDGGAEVSAKLREIAARASDELRGLQGEMSELDPGLGVQIKRTAKQVVETVEKLASKGDRVHRNSQGKGRRHERRIASLLRPRDEPQERVLGAFEITARHGSAWIAELLEVMDALPAEHLVVDLQGDPT